MTRKVLAAIIGLAVLGMASPAFAYGPADTTPGATPPAATPPAAAPPGATPPGATPPGATPPAAAPPVASPDAGSGSSAGGGSLNATLGATVDGVSGGYSAPQGATVNFTGAGMLPLEPVAIYLQGVYITSVTADASGRFDAVVKVPKGTSLGSEQLSAVGQNSRQTVTFPLNVTAAPAPIIAAAGIRARSSHFEAETGAAAAVALTVGGIAFLILRRRRLHHGTA